MLVCVSSITPKTHMFMDLPYQTVSFRYDITYIHGGTLKKQHYETHYRNYCRNTLKDIYYITSYLLHEDPRSTFLLSYNSRKSSASFKQLICFHLRDFRNHSTIIFISGADF